MQCLVAFFRCFAWLTNLNILVFYNMIEFKQNYLFLKLLGIFSHQSNASNKFSSRTFS